MRELRNSVNTRNGNAKKDFRRAVEATMTNAMSHSAVACFTFDNMAEAADVGAGVRTEPRKSGADPSLAVGFPNVYALLDAHAVTATFFVEGWNGVHHPEAVAEIVARGHELGMH